MNPRTCGGRPSRIHSLVAAVFLAAGSATACAQDAPAAKPAAEPGAAAEQKPSAASKAESSYSLGVSIGEQLRSMGLSSDAVALDRVTQGLRDALDGKAKVSPADQDKVTGLINDSRATLATRNAAAAKQFLAENGKRKGVVTTKSGLQYRIVQEGKGTPPKASDQVTVHYRGTLLDGTQFDSSIERGEPVTFPVDGVIPGWQEALQLMKPGAKWELFIPPELAYGANSPPPIPPGSLLRFDVELLNVASAGPQPGAPQSR